jgi:hypothetical protein
VLKRQLHHAFRRLKSLLAGLHYCCEALWVETVSSKKGLVIHKSLKGFTGIAHWVTHIASMRSPFVYSYSLFSGGSFAT